MQSAWVSLRGASFGYGGQAVVSGINLRVEPGSFLGITGENGSGKTTLLRGILGLLAPLSGSVDRRTRSMGYVPQREHLDSVYPLTVEEVVRMGAYGRLSGLRRLGHDERELARTSLERVGLLHRQRELFARLSGGQRQRALIARALVMRPDVLVLDEPTSGVDAQAQDRILGLLDELRRETPLAILLVTHDPEPARLFLSAVLSVGGGTVRELSPEESVLGVR